MTKAKSAQNWNPGDCEVDGMKTPPELDAIAKVVLTYRPKPKTTAAKKRKKKAAKLAKQSLQNR